MSSTRGTLQLAAIAVTLTVAIAGCGSTSSTSTTSTSPSTPLEQIAALPSVARAPAATLLVFWGNIQAKSFRAAYAALDPLIRRQVSYHAFAWRFRRSGVDYSVYALRLRRVSTSRRAASVKVTVQSLPEPTPDDPPMVFRLDRVGRRWVIASSPQSGVVELS